MPRRRKAGDPLIAVGYVRVSTDRQELGPEAQRMQLAAWARRGAIQIVGVTEDRCSGTTPVDKRQGLLLALEIVREHQAGILVVARLDRLARDVFVATAAERLAELEGARVVAADGSTQIEGPEGDLQRTMGHAFAQYERAIISLRTRQALAVKRSQGKRSNAQPPYGFRFTLKDAIEPVKDEQIAIRRMKRWRQQGRTLAWMVDRLTEMGSIPRGVRWHPTTVSRILKREGL